MKILRTTEDIYSNPWGEESDTLVSLPDIIDHWIYERSMGVDDVKLWEQLYYEPGNIGIYAACLPYAECYIIVYNLFMNKHHLGIQQFYGEGAADSVRTRAIELGIFLPVDLVWVSDTTTTG
jgi:hypothetical protein